MSLDPLVARQPTFDGARTGTDAIKGFDLSFDVQANLCVIGNGNAAAHQHHAPRTGDHAGDFLRQVQHGHRGLQTFQPFRLRAARCIRNCGESQH